MENREIKFRFWDLLDEKMLQDIDIEEYTLHSLRDFEGHLMQYTGLKDKNGKEIYEGDIVSVKSIIYDTIEPFEKSTKIEFQIFCEVIWCNKIAGYDLKKIDGDNKPDAWGFYNENVNPFEVIGNIYENPELINSK